ncbi:coiled-coil domain-containing protein R3HCC1L [Octopus sinensis]|uniref:Coiled-coil domain-containing protein R3HCC1L n=1 Tax=Octopus sinensis TaxID=2607531 RepID=A0A7E6FA66_9MOLL|nr:coiled-coil domain-containing protein R3HCC1L [Octopus sinensis]
MLQNGISEPISSAGSRPLRGRGRGRLIHPVNSSVFNKEPLPVVLKNQKDDEKIKYCSDSTNTSRAKQKKPEQQLYIPRPRRIKQQLYQDTDNYQQQQQQQQQQQLQYSTEEEDDIRSGQAPYQHELSSSLCNTGQSSLPARKNTSKNGCNLKKNRREVEIYVPRAKRQMQLQSGGGGFDVSSKSIPPADCREPTSPLDRISKDYDIESLSVNNSNNINNMNRSARCQDAGCDIYFQLSRSHHGLEGFSPGIKDTNSGVPCNFSNNVSHKSGKGKRYEYHCNSSSADFGYSDKDSLSPLSLKSQSVAGNHDRESSSFHRPAAGAAAVAIQRTRSPETRAIINKVSRRDGISQETSNHNHSTSMSARKYSKEVSPTPNTLQNTKTDLSSAFSPESTCDSDSDIKLPNALFVPSKDNTPLEPFTLAQGDEDHRSSAGKTVPNQWNESSASVTRERTLPNANSLSTKQHSDSTNSENVHAPSCDQTESEESSETEADLSQSHLENMNSSQHDCNSSKTSINESYSNACELSTTDQQQESELSCSTNCDCTGSGGESSLDRSSPSSSKLDQCDGDMNSKFKSSTKTTTTPSNDSTCSSESTAKTEKFSPQMATSTAVVDDESWEALYDDNGDCLEPQALEELTTNIGKVQIQKNKINYLDFQPKDTELDYKAYDHVLEVFDFSSELQTRDIISVFSNFKERGFDIKWVDDTHALAIFNSPVAANDALAQNHPLLKVRPMSEASKKSKQKAKRCTEFLQPYKPRPETSAITARRMVTGALGLTPHISKQKRDQERQQLKEAREKKRQDRLTKNSIWDGNIGKCAMDTGDN